MITRAEVRQHSTKQSCWLIINSIVYDVTTFADKHPGGASILLKYAGRDATKAFESFHQGDILKENLSPQQILGAVTDKDSEPSSEPSDADKKPPPSVQKSARLSAIISISDFELTASKNLVKTSFACKWETVLRSGAEDEQATKWNRNSWKAIRLRPRILRPINNGINTTRSILGTTFSAPFFICPAGGAKLAHPQGDLCLTKAAARHGILHWTCNNAAISLRDLADVRAPEQTTYWQIYASADLAVTERQVRQAIELGYKGFALTVDAIWAGKRESDLRANVVESEEYEEEDENENFAKEPTVKRS
ncbi:FMN-dependent dehydrogenase-domain-containing protein [Aspergillus pseudoustus]|uniref:FMN-dependent dehydrogenase-domain-containing protein n=1 Tax=Aspergillus pseudoustus TaxID=1810923 RepID=A0ABR4IB19_9EURO